MSLLEKAKATSAKRKRMVPSADELELALAFFRGEITGPQVNAAFGRRAGANPWHHVAGFLRNGIILGLVEIKAVGK